MNGSVKDDVIIAALASGKTQVEAAEIAGVGRHTVIRRLQDPEFKGRVDAMKAEVVSQITDKIMALALRAVHTMGELMDPDKPPGVRRAAAADILNRCLGKRLEEPGEGNSEEGRGKCIEERVRARLMAFDEEQRAAKSQPSL